MDAPYPELEIDLHRVQADAYQVELKHESSIRGAQLSDDETRILTWSGDGTTRLWDTATGTALSPPLPHHPIVRAPKIAEQARQIRTCSQDLGLRGWDISVDSAWPIDKTPLKVEAETGTQLTSTDEIEFLSRSDWTRKRFCEYDAIRQDLKRISDAEWAESQRRCRQAQDADAPKRRPPVGETETRAAASPEIQ